MFITCDGNFFYTRKDFNGWQNGMFWWLERMCWEFSWRDITGKDVIICLE